MSIDYVIKKLRIPPTVSFIAVEGDAPNECVPIEELSDEMIAQIGEEWTKSLLALKRSKISSAGAYNVKEAGEFWQAAMDATNRVKSMPEWKKAASPTPEALATKAVDKCNKSQPPKPSVGRIVNYRTTSTLAQPRTYAAIISEVSDAGTVSLAVIGAGEIFHVFDKSEGTRAGTWSWPERI